VHRQADLLQVVDALGSPGRLARRLDRGQQQGDQDGDDRDHHQEFDQGKCSSSTGHVLKLLSKNDLVEITR
jgi:hypothetical protein